MQKKNYRLAALDMDGTLLNSDHKVSDYTLDVLARVDAAGKIAALATGRCLSELLEFIDAIPALRYVICENGANIYDTRLKRSIHRVSFSEDDVDFLIGELEKRTVIAQMFMNDQSYIRAPIEIDLAPYRLSHFRSVFEAGSVFDPNLFELYRTSRPPVDKIDLYFTGESDRESFRAIAAKRNIEIAASIGIGLELSPLNANKSDGLVKLCELLDVPVSESIAVGDADNDKRILQVAGLAVAMGNAFDEIKAIADVVTDDCDHHGAAKALEKYLLNGGIRMIPDCNLFMMCKSLNESALTELPVGYHIRSGRRDELEIWKAIHFDTPAEAAANHAYMTGFFDRVYAPDGELFFKRCLFICDSEDRPVGTCTAWRNFGCATTIHWFKILREYEGKGLGRALLSEVMRRLSANDYPVFLHTQPSSYRAVKLYSDFGFSLLTDAQVGHRSNDLSVALPHLKNIMPAAAFESLRFAAAPKWFLDAAASVNQSVF